MNPALNTVILAFRGGPCLAAELSLTDALLLAAVFGALTIGGIYYLTTHIRRVRNFRRKVAKRRHVPTDEYLTTIGADSKYDAVYIAMRDTMAHQAKVPPEVIYPTDTLDFIYLMTLDGFDSVKIVMALEDSLGVSIPDEIAEQIVFPKTRTEYASISLSDCVGKMLECEALRLIES
jgi:acyl carrier protein